MKIVAIVACLLVFASCEARVHIESKPAEVEKADPPQFKFFVVYTGERYAEASPNVAGYRLHSIQAHSEGSDYVHNTWVTLIYELENPE
mgnify:CR=1 FL=1